MIIRALLLLVIVASSLLMSAARAQPVLCHSIPSAHMHGNPDTEMVAPEHADHSSAPIKHCTMNCSAIISVPPYINDSTPAVSRNFTILSTALLVNGSNAIDLPPPKM